MMAPGRSAWFPALAAAFLLISSHLEFGSGARHGVVDRRRRIDEIGGLCAAAIAGYGYECKEYKVTTEDGYILSLQRIPEGRANASDEAGNSSANNATSRRPPVLLQHGILMDGLTWAVNSPEQSLAYILADHGFDVWIANTRGTQWSRAHTSLDPADRDYWDWSWDELVMYDLPAVVNFVHEQTGQNMHYVGHSLGTLTAMSSFSELKLVDKITSAAFLCPVAYLSHMTTALGVVAAKSILGEVFAWLGVAEFDPSGPIVGLFLKSLCDLPEVSCFDLMTVITGSNCCLNASTVDFFLRYEPQATSTKTLVHLAQTVRSGVLTKYDYGNTADNINHYGQSEPPSYNLSDIPHDLPLFLSYGGRDALADPQDVLRLVNDDLRGHDGDKLDVQLVEDFAHADFIMAVTAKQVVYDRLIAFFNKHQ